MCGIAGSFGRDVSAGIEAQRYRGPDAAGVVGLNALQLGHARLAIIDPDHRSDQPLTYGGVTVVFAGELWNYRAVRDALRARGRTFVTTGDTEVFAAALDCWGEAALGRLDGMFAVAWTDDGGTTVKLARDRFGEIPLHIAAAFPFSFATEIKALLAMGCSGASITMVAPGTVVTATARQATAARYYDVACRPIQIDPDDAAERVRTLLVAGTDRRQAAADVPVCVLLSGGIDSAAITWALQRTVSNLVAYTAVLDPRSSDLREARAVAASFGIRLIEVPVSAPTANDLATVVNVIEMPYKAQVEIGWPCLALARRIKHDGFKVVFSGEGSDELWGSYQFAFRALAAGQDFGAYRKALFVSQERKNFARCNKVFLRYGVECRLPFLERPLVELALSLPKQVAWDGRDQKAIMRRAWRGILPTRTVDRPKVAFQDALGVKRAAATVVADPKRFYRAEFVRRFGEGKRGAVCLT